MVWMGIVLGACDVSPMDTTPPPTDGITCDEEILFDGVETGAGVPTGYVRCSDGAINRAEIRPTVQTESQIDACDIKDENAHTCRTDADCPPLPEGASGVCGEEFVGGSSACRCEYPCNEDADCGEGYACLQSWSKWDRPHCEPVVDCLENADCPSGECGLLVWTPIVTSALTLACRTDTDECRSDDDCDPGQQVFCGDRDTWGCYTNGYD